MLARLITTPRTRELGALASVSPVDTDVPSISIRPSGWLVPSRRVVAVIVGRLVDGLMVWNPAPMPENRIVSGPTAELAALIASRRLQCRALQVPSLASLVELTMKVAVGAEGTRSTGSAPPRARTTRSERASEFRRRASAATGSPIAASSAGARSDGAEPELSSSSSAEASGSNRRRRPAARSRTTSTSALPEPRRAGSQVAPTPASSAVSRANATASPSGVS